MRTLRFHEFGAPLDVLRLEDTAPPTPGPGQIRVVVQTCGLTPADWALCDGLFPGDLPRGIGLEVSGTVDALGDGVTGVEIGEPVLGPAPFTGPTAGASEQALLDIWFPRPPGLDPTAAAALPMAVETACRGLEQLGIRTGDSVLIHGAGTTVGYAAVQMAVRHGARVIATAGKTYADALRAAGAEVTGYGDGMVERVRTLAGGAVDLTLDAAPFSNVLPDLIRTVEAPAHVFSFAPPGSTNELGINLGRPDAPLRHEAIGEYAQLASEGRFSVPVAGTFALEDWRTAAAASLSGHAHGKLVLQIS
ncbi:NADP-dependent oxidoreductase [Nocardia sp. NPDC019395]|uniref:NADP-dependent oxidoreductase n=1 Tax=Nocardia sp. NPDC019395 TaxID=3154686 RepID=UPI003401BB5E